MTGELEESTTASVSHHHVPTMSPPDEEVTESMSGEVSPSGVPTASPQDVPTPEKSKRIDIKLSATLRPLLGSLRQDEESDAAVVKRILESVPTLRGRNADLASDNEHLQKANTEIRETLEIEQHRHQTQFDDQVYEIGQLRARITTLENAAGTAVVPVGEQVTLDSFGIKDIMEDAKDVCGGDDPACMKVAAKMLDMKAHFASKAVDHEHVAEENRLDREEKEKDRVLKKSMAEDERQLKKELSYIKKGYIPKGDLDDLVDIGRIQPKNAKKSLGYAKQQANAEADEEETPARSGLTEGEMDDEWDE